MSRISLDMYYVGHGAMFYAEILDDADNLEMKLLVDAGSNSDETGEGAQNSMEDVIGRIMANSAPLIICITHLHTDHYSFIWELFVTLNNAERFEMLEAFYVGSMRFGSKKKNLIEYADAFQDIGYLVRARNKPAWKHLGFIVNEEDLWQSADEQVRLTVLFNLLGGDGDENDNSAVFCLKHDEAKQMVMFTGDITGTTLTRICSSSSSTCLGAFVAAVNGYSVWMTVPHHGSIHTLEKDDFIIQAGRQGQQSYYTSRNLDNLFQPAGLRDMGFFISTGVKDKFGHPDYFVTRMFYNYAEKVPALLEHFPCYRTYDTPGYSMPRNLPPPGNGGWFAFTNQRRVYTTVVINDMDNPEKQELRTIHQDFPDEEELWKNRRLKRILEP